MIEPAIVALLSPLVGGRVYPDLAPTNAALPRIVYQQVGGEAYAYVEKRRPSSYNGRYQVVVWAETRESAATLSLQAEKALIEATTLSAIPLGAMSAIHEADTGLRGARQDFSITADR